MKPRAPLGLLLIALALILLPPAVVAQAAPPTLADDPQWISQGPADGLRVHLYFFWSERCPHCLEARPFVLSLARENPWIVLHDAEVSRDRNNLERYSAMARALDQEALSVPAFLFCGRMLVGYDSAETTGEFLHKALGHCREAYRQNNAEAAPEPEPPPLYLPFVGELNTAQWSLPALTLVLALLDSFNPCAFFVLLFLLSLMVHAGSRYRMLFIGGTFVLVSGLVYFLFMSAWLNLFFLVGQATWITAAAGVIALALGAINIKDFFWIGEGVSLSIPDNAKPGIFKRARDLLQARSLGSLFVGTLVLAIAANSYELLCTAGFPMVYTRALTLHELPTSHYYGYLIAYNTIYVLPLLLIVVLFSFTLGSRKLRAREGRLLKLISGLMMLELGLILVSAPQLLSNALVAVGLLLFAVLAGAALARVKP